MIGFLATNGVSALCLTAILGVGGPGPAGQSLVSAPPVPSPALGMVLREGLETAIQINTVMGPTESSMRAGPGLPGAGPVPTPEAISEGLPIPAALATLLAAIAMMVAMGRRARG